MICFQRKTQFQIKKKWTLIQIKKIQIKTVKMITKIFKSIANATLNVEFHLLSIENHLNVIFYDFMLKIITNSIYSHIRIQRKLFDKQLIFDQIQHQNMLYSKLNSLHKLKMKYTVVFNKNIF